MRAIEFINEHRDMCSVCGQTPCNCTHLDEDWRSKVAAASLGAAALAGGLGSDYLSRSTAPQASAPSPAPMVQQHKTPADYLRVAAQQADIKGNELAQFLAQCSHETLNFTRMEEHGTPQYFAKKYDPKHNPRKAKILGNKLPGDGEKFKGRGFIQLTGRDNYQRAGQALGLDLVNHPELAAKPDNAAKIAVWYWKNRVAPKIADFSNTKAVTKKINPGLQHQARRQQQFKNYQLADL